MYEGETKDDKKHGVGFYGWELGDGELGEKLRQYSSIITEFNSDVWAAKNEAGLGRGKPISGIEIPSELEEFSNHLITMHKLE